MNTREYSISNPLVVCQQASSVESPSLKYAMHWCPVKTMASQKGRIQFYKRYYHDKSFLIHYMNM